jgi:eukaryotic translation initiation factor 2C
MPRSLQAKGRKRPGEKRAQVVAVPMEMLTIARGQKRRGLLIGDQQANLVRKAAQPPEQKRGDIATWMAKKVESFAQSKRDFGIDIDSQPVTVDGRLLPAPVLQYGQPKNYYAGTTGAWNMINVCFCVP